MFKSTAGKFAKVNIGTPDLSKLSLSQFTTAGVLTNPGISIFGGVLPSGIIRAGVSIGPPAALPGLTLPFSLEVSGISNFIGVTNQIGAYNCTGASIFNGTQTTNGVNTVNAASIFNGVVTVNGATAINGATNINGTLTVTGLATFTLVAAPFKQFDILHPSKTGYRLRHACIEGPEIGVYFRGKSKTDMINLPDYWKDLVHEDTITVNLTPIGQNQNLYVEYIKDNLIKVGGGAIIQGEKQFNYHYTVFGERKDVDKLVPEYEGIEITHQGGAE